MRSSRPRYPMNPIRAALSVLPVYAAGFLLTACGDPLGPDPDLWAEGSWHALAEGLDGPVYSIAEHDGAIYAGGAFETAAGRHHLLRWDGSSWNPVDPDVDGLVRAMVSFGGDLVVLGHFDNAGGAPANRAARWDGTGWHAMDGNLSDLCCQPMLATDGDRLFASGRFVRESDGAVVIGASIWTGTQWSRLEFDDFPAVAPFVIHGGNFVTDVRFRYTVAMWDGSAWTSLGEPQPMLRHLVSLEDALYSVRRVEGGSLVARWDGASWAEVGAIEGLVSAAVAHNGSLIITAFFDDEWTGSVLRLTPEGWEVIGEADGPIAALTSHGRALVASGSFTSIGGVPARRVAVFRTD